MNKVAKIGLMTGGGLAGFVFAYAAFALLLGVQPSEIPVLGRVFPAPAGDGQQTTASAGEGRRDPTPQPAGAVRAGVGLLDVFQIESPYTSSELEQLVGDLKRKNKELDQRRFELSERERRATERAEFLDEQYAELQRLRTGLEEWENELRQRQVEVERDERAQKENEAASWAKLGKLFAEGDPLEQGKRLAASYTPEQAARILQTLKPARVKELLDCVGAEKWKEYADAYRLAEDEGQ